VVVLKNKVYVYRLADLTKLHSIATCDNPTGICSVTYSEQFVLATLGDQPNQVRILNTKRSDTFVAHDHPVNQLCLSSTGERLATSSVKGTLVRVFDTSRPSTPVVEFKRGNMEANITSLAWCPKGHYLALASSTGTIHIFSPNASAGWLSSWGSSALPSISQATVLSNDNPICSFFQNSSNSSSLTLMVICQSGTFYRFLIMQTPNGYVCKEDMKYQFYNSTGKCTEPNY